MLHFGSTYPRRKLKVVYEYEGKTNLVPGQEIRLGVGSALRVAGLGRVSRMVGAARRRRIFHRAAEYCFVCSLCDRSGHRAYYRVPDEGRETALALGEGLNGCVNRRMPGLRSQFILAFGVEELMGAVVVGFGHENFRQSIQVAILGQAGVHEFLRGNDAVFLEHHYEHLGVHDRAGVEKLHTLVNHEWTRMNTD